MCLRLLTKKAMCQWRILWFRLRTREASTEEVTESGKMNIVAQWDTEPVCEEMVFTNATFSVMALNSVFTNHLHLGRACRSVGL